MANSVKIFESSSLDRTQEVMKWIEFGVSISKTIFYPIKKASHFVETQTQMNTITSFSPGKDISIQNLAKSVTTKVDKVIPRKDLIDTISDILSYISYGFTANKITNILLADEEADLDFMCIHVKRRHLEITKKIIFAMVIFAAIGYMVSKLFKSGEIKYYDDEYEEPGKWDKFKTFIKDSFKIIKTLFIVLYALYLVSKLIKNQINGKRWTINDSELLISCIGMFLEVLEIPQLEQAMIKSVKPYWIGVGVTSLVNLAKTVILPFTTPQPVNIDNGLFDKPEIKSDSKKLFVYFCGSGESTKRQLKRFMNDVNAKHQIYINGVGSQRTIYKNLYEEDLKVAELQIGSNTMQYQFFNKNRDIKCIEKFYTGGDRGYKNDDAEKASLYVLNAINETLKNNAIEELILSGHGRGAAVGLVHLLHRMKSDSSLVERMSNLKISVIPIEAVAGQFGNDYGQMGENWYSGLLYDQLFEKFVGKIAISEIWANSGGNNRFVKYNPAKKFLSNPEKKIKLTRLLLGFEHNALVDNNDEYLEGYDQRNAPYHQVVKFINEHAPNLHDDAADYASTIRDIQANYDEINSKMKKQDLIEKGYTLRANFKDYKDNERDFFEFVTSYKFA
ncbi:hypothetical protein ACJVDH_07905 [Pedobacter sp. AW1-32]|uniref:hypothetical protein n=1 Tax=Pedobacter sp. AW1-32 TaxID=3383026 RepID=UPI003FEF4C53